MTDQLCEYLREFFEILDLVEETDSGEKFHPTSIHSSRTSHVERLSVILPRMRQYINDEERADQESLDAFALGRTH